MRRPIEYRGESDSAGRPDFRTASGVSFARAFDSAAATSKHRTQYFEMFGHRAVHHDGWRAVCPWPGTSFVESGLPFGAPITHDKLTELDATAWELYHIDEDFAENHDVSKDHRDKLIEMIATWYVEAGKYDVLPIDSRGTLRFADQRPTIAGDRTSYTYYPGTQTVPPNSSPRTLNRPHSYTADVDVPTGGAEGVLLSAGGVDGGFTLYVKDGKLQFDYNYLSLETFHVESNAVVPEGRHQLRYEFEPTGKPDIANGKGTPGRAQLYIDGKLVGQADFPVTVPLNFSLAGGFQTGSDTGSPVTDRYTGPFPFTGTLYGVTTDLSGDLIQDKDAEMKMLLARQ
ncbi:MAG: hypothetical protein ABI231_04985 [Candidatus Tumulicola sp.]